MNEQSQMNMERRVQLSAEASQIVYNFEQNYTKLLAEPSKTQQEISKQSMDYFNKIKEFNEFKNYELFKGDATIIDATYDSETGVAAIAVKDHVTDETYLAFAGTNYEADTYKDIRSDAAIGINDPLYLKKNAQPALDFYEKIERRGENITVTTGHSYGVHGSGRVALEKQVPFHFGHQGAPLSVNKETAQEMAFNRKNPVINLMMDTNSFEEFFQEINNPFYVARYALATSSLTKGLSNLVPDPGSIPMEDLRAYWEYFQKFKNITPAEVKAAKRENERLHKLVDNYSGYSVTFSTTRDLLTNLVWSQRNKEISFRGQAFDGFLKEYLLDSFTPSILAFLGMSMDTLYPGKVYVIDRAIPHNMKAILDDPEALAYAKEQVLRDLYTVDIDGNGQLDFTVSSEQLTKRPLFPTWAAKSGKIDLNTEALLQLSHNLGRELEEVRALQDICRQSLWSVENTLATHANRRQNLSDAIASYLESISLIQAIREIDRAYTSLDEKSEQFYKIAKYDVYSDFFSTTPYSFMIK